MTRALKPVWPDVIFSRVSPVHFAEIPDPPLPGPRWVRVKNYQCGICASDLSLLTVDADPGIAPAALPGLQRFYLGHELVGEIGEVGPGVTRVRPGDRVIMDAETPPVRPRRSNRPARSAPAATRCSVKTPRRAAAGTAWAAAGATRTPRTSRPSTRFLQISATTRP